MIKALYNKDVYQAFRYNPYVFISLPVIGCICIIQIICYIKDNTLNNTINKLILAYIISLLIYAILRNTELFSWLAPTKV